MILTPGLVLVLTTTNQSVSTHSSLGITSMSFTMTQCSGILPEEIILNEEIPYFDLKHNRIRKLKNEESIRQVPIKQECIPFVKHLTLHPEGASYSPGEIWSRRLKRRTGYPAHSLRHNFINRMRKAGIEYSLAMAIVGHSPKGTTADYGDIFLEDLEQAVHNVQ